MAEDSDSDFDYEFTKNYQGDNNNEISDIDLDNSDYESEEETEIKNDKKENRNKQKIRIDNLFDETHEQNLQLIKTGKKHKFQIYFVKKNKKSTEFYNELLKIKFIKNILVTIYPHATEKQIIKYIANTGLEIYYNDEDITSNFSINNFNKEFIEFLKSKEIEDFNINSIVEFQKFSPNENNLIKIDFEYKTLGKYHKRVENYQYEEGAQKIIKIDEYGKKLQYLLDRVVRCTYEPLLSHFRERLFKHINKIGLQASYLLHIIYDAPMIPMRVITFNINQKYDMIKLFDNKFIVDESNPIQSSTIGDLKYYQILDVSIIKIKPELEFKNREQRRNNHGGIFNHFNRYEEYIDLRFMQIYSEKSINEDKNVGENCLLFALKIIQKKKEITNDQIYQIAQIINNRIFVPKAILNRISIISSYSIGLVEYDNSRKRYSKYEIGKVNSNISLTDFENCDLKLCLLYNHYFVYNPNFPYHKCLKNLFLKLKNEHIAKYILKQFEEEINLIKETRVKQEILKEENKNLTKEELNVKNKNIEKEIMKEFILRYYRIIKKKLLEEQKNNIVSTLKDPKLKRIKKIEWNNDILGLRVDIIKKYYNEEEIINNNMDFMIDILYNDDVNKNLFFKEMNGEIIKKIINEKEIRELYYENIDLKEQDAFLEKDFGIKSFSEIEGVHVKCEDNDINNKKIDEIINEIDMKEYLIKKNENNKNFEIEKSLEKFKILLRNSINLPKNKDHMAEYYIFADTESNKKKIKITPNKKVIKYINKNVPYSIGWVVLTKQEILNIIRDNKLPNEFNFKHVTSVPQYVERRNKNNQKIKELIENTHCLEIFLKQITSLQHMPIIYFHNMKFDVSLFCGIKNFKTIHKVEVGTAKYEQTCLYYDFKLKFVDSWKLIQKPLRDFPKMFNLETKKEYMPYSVFTEENLLKRVISLKELKKIFNEKEIEGKTYKEFIEHMKKVQKETSNMFLKKINNEIYFDLFEYNYYYLKYDVIVLTQGILSFGMILNKWNYIPVMSMNPERKVKILFQKYIDENIEQNKIKQISKLIIEKFNLDKKRSFNLFHYSTSSKLADDYLIKKGCYEGVSFIKNSVAQFIRKCIYGGQTICGYNKQHKYEIKDQLEKVKKTNLKLFKDENLKLIKSEKFIEELKEMANQIKNKQISKEEAINGFSKKYYKNYISDYDGVSQYPSAMALMAGFIKGVPYLASEEEIAHINQGETVKNKLNRINLFLQSKNKKGCHAFMAVKFKKFEKKSQFPLFTKQMKNINEVNNNLEENQKIKNTSKNMRQWVNELPDKVMHVDIYQLEAICLTHKVTDCEFKHIIYFPEGYNNKINEVIKELFNIRKVYKKEKNPMEEVCKVIMNSAYGRTIMKNDDNYTEYKCCTSEELIDYISLNNLTCPVYVENQNINEKNENNYMIVHKNYNYEEKNRAHIGTTILSYSKKLMLNATLIADQLGIILFYKDTDSMFTLYSEILKIMDAYKEKYNRSLDGQDLGQFHIDFSLKYFDIEKNEHKKIKEYDCDIVFGVAGIWLNKKEYCIILEGVNILEETIYYEEIFRFKGIPSKSMVNYSEEYSKKNEIYTIFKIYDLYNSNKEHDVETVGTDGFKVKYESKGTYSTSVESCIKKLDLRWFTNRLTSNKFIENIK